MINESLALLGQQMRDRVTGFNGMVSSVTFDAYGCVQALITPAAREGKLQEQAWFDVKRLDQDGERIMPAATFGATAASIPGGNALPRPASAPVPG